MYKRILMSMMAFGLAAFLMGGATMAWFTATTTSAVKLESGNVDIGVSGTVAGFADPVTWTAAYNNMAPGQTVSTQMEVTNKGSLPMKYRVWASIEDLPGNPSDAGLASALTVVVKKGTSSLMPSRALNAFAATNAVIRDGGNVLAKDATEILTFEVTLPTSANNLVANKDVNVVFHFDATQPDNTGWNQ